LLDHGGLTGAGTVRVMRRRQRSELVVAPQPGGVVVQGPPGKVRAFAERVRSIARSVDVERIATMLTTAAAAIDELAGSGDGTPQYFEFSPRAMDLLKQFGALPAGDGFFRSMVRDGEKFAGNLDWTPIDASADLLQLQTSAVGLVLQASIKDLADSVQRVEDRLEHLLDTIWADKVGEIVAHHRVLSELIESSNQGHPLSATDWSSIDHLRTEIGRNIDACRVLLRLSVARADPGRTASSRSAAAKKLLESDFVEGLALLAVCEHNLASWHHLRLQQVRENEPEHLERTLGRVETDLTLHQLEDQRLVDDLTFFVDRLAQPRGLEGLELWKRDQLQANTESLRVGIDRFATQRTLDVRGVELAPLPTLRESLNVAKDWSVDHAQDAVRWVRRRGSSADDAADDAAAELESGDEAPALDADADG
jgi:hypothetical protein